MTVRPHSSSISKDELLSLVRAQSGHFVYESGYHSDTWWDLEALCHRPAALLPYVNVLATRIQEYKPDVVCGALVEGAFVALLAASNLHADFAYALRSGGDPKQLFSVSYHLPNALHDVVKGKRVVIANDVISACFGKNFVCGYPTIVHFVPLAAFLII
jgi:orotate phosphoribosyltransferase